MKWLLGVLVALLMVSSAMAGEDPYIALVGNDVFVANNSDFYFSPKHLQFVYDQESFQFSIPVCETTYGFIIPAYRTYARGCEQFRSSNTVNQPEICDTLGTRGPAGYTFSGLTNARVTAGNSGWYQWYIRLPKKPSGEINLCFQCGVLKPNSLPFFRFEGQTPDEAPAAVQLCAAETGERIGAGLCVREEVDAGINPLIIDALPTVTAVAYPGAFANGTVNPDTGAFTGFTPFNLTAFRNPGTYAFEGALPAGQSNASTQVLNNGIGTRILLKSCFDKCIVVKLPVTGQINGAAQTETDLEAGDIIYVKLTIPRANTVDIYCNPLSLKIAGIGEAP